MADLEPAPPPSGSFSDLQDRWWQVEDPLLGSHKHNLSPSHVLPPASLQLSFRQHMASPEGRGLDGVKWPRFYPWLCPYWAIHLPLWASIFTFTKSRLIDLRGLSSMLTFYGLMYNLAQILFYILFSSGLSLFMYKMGTILPTSEFEDSVRSCMETAQCQSRHIITTQ